MIAVFKPYLYNGWTDLENLFDNKNVDIGEHTSEVWSHSVSWHHHTSKKRRCFFICPSVTLVLGYSSFISLEDLGCKISGLLTPFWHFFIFLNFGWKRKNLKKKWKKRFFGWAKTGKHGYFCITPTGLPDDFSGFYYLFPDRRHVSDVPFLSDEVCTS